MSRRKQKTPVVLIYAQFPPGEDSGATRSIEPWVREAEAIFGHQPQFDVISLFGTDARHDRIVQVLRRVRSRKGLVAFYGAGCECGSALFEDQIALQRDDMPLMPAIGLLDAGLLSNKIVYVVACHSGKLLGRSLTDGRHSTTYIGYEDEVSASDEESVDFDSIQVPGFQESVNSGLTVLHEGGTCREARDRIYDEYQWWIDYWMERNDMPKVLTLIGNQQALSLAIGNPRESLM